jgi:sulfopyruvate decarboxylase subunit alpha
VPGAEQALQSQAEWPDLFASALTESGVSLATIVPDSATSKIYSRLSHSIVKVAITREEEAIGVLAGGYLTGHMGVALMQNTGLGNAVNAIAGYAIPAGIPMLLIVNVRGGIGEFSPAQVALGQATTGILEACRVPYTDIVSPESIGMYVAGAVRLAKAFNGPVALLLRPELIGWKEG